MIVWLENKKWSHPKGTSGWLGKTKRRGPYDTVWGWPEEEQLREMGAKPGEH